MENVGDVEFESWRVRYDGGDKPSVQLSCSYFIFVLTIPDRTFRQYPSHAVHPSRPSTRGEVE